MQHVDLEGKFDLNLTPRAVALEIQQRLCNGYDIDSELWLDKFDRPLLKFVVGGIECHATIGRLIDFYCVYFGCAHQVAWTECLTLSQLLTEIKISVECREFINARYKIFV